MKQLKNIYFDAANPAGYASRKALFNTQTTHLRKQVASWLSSQDTYTLHKPINQKFPRNSYILLGIDDLWQADLIDLPAYSRENKGIKHILVIIDCFSKFVWAYTCETKSSSEICAKFEKVFKTGRRPRNLTTDKGFSSTLFSKLMKTHGVNFYVSQNPDIKASIAERVIRTIKSRLFKILTTKRTKKYYDSLSKIVSAYNNSIHSSTKLKPVDVSIANEGIVRERLNKHVNRGKPKLSVGDTVRISKERSVFNKGYTANWSKELFLISSITSLPIPMYKLIDLFGEDIIGSFYGQELQQINIKTKTKGKKRVR